MLAGPDLGTVALGATLTAPVVVETTAGVPSDPATAPTFRAYGPAGLMSNGTGVLSKLDTKSVTGASNANPVSVTAAGHGLNTGTRVSVSGVGGNTAANAETTATVVNANTFTLDGVAGNGAYTSGGSVHVSGLYQLSLPVNSGDGYAAGGTYYVLVSWVLGGVSLGMLCPFRVV